VTTGSQADYRDVVAALRDVPGVAEADVEPDDEGGLGVLRLGLQPGVDEVEVATTVGRLLREQFGLGVDADRVQIVEDADIPVVERGMVPLQRVRPAINRMHLVSSGLDVTATVTLSSGERLHAGEARGTASQAGVQRAVANATLRAVEELLDGAVRFELDHLEVSTVGAERTVLVSLSMVSARGSERLTGAAAVREDVRQAVIRSTLDALNRRLETLLD
jgi:hypothetical protein